MEIVQDMVYINKSYALKAFEWCVYTEIHSYMNDKQHEVEIGLTSVIVSTLLFKFGRQNNNIIKEV